MTTAEAVVQRQLDAYNARDLDAWVATYALHAKQFALHGTELASGRSEIRARMVDRFAEPDLHALLLSRTVMGHVVVDHERVSRHFAEGYGTIDMICIYEVGDGLIQNATFALGPRTLHPHTD